METEVVAKGFWSYARTDDEREGGRIVRLAGLIRAEFETLTGTSITIFVDRDAIRWGQDFRQELDQALQSTTFFIPILTPTYFLREECRREMRHFVAAAASLGLEELLLSIRYTPVPDLSEDSADELKAIAARMQFERWDDLRLADETSAPYRAGVHRLATRLVEVTNALESRPTSALVPSTRSLTSELLTGTPRLTSPEDIEVDLDEPGLIELFADFGPASTEWQATLEEFPRVFAPFNELFDDAGKKMHRADEKPSAFAAKIAIARQLAQDLETPMSEIEAISKRYSSGLLRLDPIVRAVLANASQVDTTESEAVVASVRGLVEAAREAMNGVSRSTDAARQSEGISRDLRPILRRFQAAMRNVLDGQEIIEGWLPPDDGAEGAA